jgi:hypothetical protein
MRLGEGGLCNTYVKGGLDDSNPPADCVELDLTPIDLSMLHKGCAERSGSAAYLR